MKKVCSKWKVFLIVLCMLFTMTPTAVFAEGPADQPVVVEDQQGDLSGEQQGQEEPGAPPDGTATPLGITDPGNDEETPGTEEPKNEDGITPTDQGVQTLTMAPTTFRAGKIEITKIVNNGPETNDTFYFEIFKKQIHWPFKYEKVRDASIAGAGTLTVDNLWPGDYKVKEVRIPDYYIADSEETDSFNLASDSTVPVTFTNTYGLGTITIEKNIENGISSLQDTFTFELYKKNKKGKWDLIDTVSRTGAGTITIKDLLIGEYLVKEVLVPKNYEANTVYETAVIKREKNYADKVTFTNRYTAGTITINKLINGNPQSPAVFVFKVFQWNDRHRDWDYYKSISIEGTGSVIVAGLADDLYKIVEEDVTGYDIDQSKPVVKISKKDGRHKQATFTNTYNGPTTGSIKLIKHVSAECDYPKTVFDFTVECSENEYREYVSVTSGAFVILDGLVPGKYEVTEAFTEDFYPEENDYDQSATVTAGSETVVTFTNYYDPEQPSVRVIKEVAPYSGTGVPETGFVKNLSLTELNKSVIYRIKFITNEAWVRSYGYLNLRDLYDRKGSVTDITYQLRLWNGDEFVLPDGFSQDEVYYYMDTLTSNGTYTNTAYHCEPEYSMTLMKSEEKPEVNCNVISSSSAVVTVNYSPGGGDEGSSGGSRHYYKVTYDPNYPTGAVTSGMVPIDSNSYGYNNPVNVKGNTGDLTVGTYVFAGWNTKPDGSGTAYTQGDIFNIKENITLYAQWKLIGETETEMAVIEEGTPASALKADLDDVPKTGDSMPLLPIMLLGLLSAGALLTLGRKRPEEN